MGRKRGVVNICILVVVLKYLGVMGMMLLLQTNISICEFIGKIITLF
jgi:hypothetical protein